MQGGSDDQRDVFDVESVAGHLLPAGSVFAFLAEHRHRLFPSDMFEDLFGSGRGRPSIPPDVVATVIVLQTLNGLSDREAVEAVTFDLRWKAACGIAIDAASFHPSTLTYWRRRLAASDRPERIFEAVSEVIDQTGAVAGKQRRALDSTVLDDAVARQDTVTHLVASIRRVGREVPGAHEVIATGCTGHDYSQPGKPRIAWDDPDAREELVTRLVNDALALLAALDVEAIAAAGGKPAEDPDGTDGRWRIARNVAGDRMISTVDPESRHAHKTRERHQDGFKAHVVAEPDTGLTTAVKLTRVNGPQNSDAAVGIDLITADPTITEDSIQVLGDSAYPTGDMLHALDQKRWTPLVKPWPIRPAVVGGFTIDDFTHDPAGAHGAGTVTCPAGQTRMVTKSRKAIFGTACRDCPLRAQCTTAKRGRTLVLHPHDLLQREHRVLATDEGFQAIYRTHRPMVERSIAWLTRGNRRVPYRGVEKNNAWLHHRVAALNLRRLLAMGLTIDNGAWHLA